MFTFYYIVFALLDTGTMARKNDADHIWFHKKIAKQLRMDFLLYLS